MPGSEGYNRPGMAGRLAAILYADLVGYSALEAWDEAAAKSRATAFRDLVAAETATAGGRIAEAAAATALAEFPGAGAAVSCAEKILQRVAARNAGLAPAEQFAVTLGVAQGEVMDEAGALMGLPVRTAVAAHTLADPGGIALTEAVHRAVRGQSALRGALLRPVKFEHLPDPVRVFVVPPAGAGYTLWVIRKRRLVPALAAAALVGAAGFVAVLRLLPAAGGEAPAAPAPPARTARVTEPLNEPSRISTYEGGGSTIRIAFGAAADGTPLLTCVVAGGRGWWGIVMSRDHDWTGADALLIPARAAVGTTFRVMIADDDEGFRALATATAAGGVLRIPLSAFAGDPAAKRKDGTPVDGTLNLARITQIQFMHADPAGSDTLWIGPISVDAPAAGAP